MKGIKGFFRGSGGKDKDNKDKVVEKPRVADSTNVLDAVKPGVKVDIFVDDSPPCDARVESISEGGRIVVLLTTQHASVVIGSMVKIFYYPANDRFSMDVEVEDINYNKSLQRIKLKPASKPSNEQRRKSYRLDVDRSVEIMRYGNIPLPTKAGGELSEMDRTSLENVSETGALIRTEQSYEKGEKLFLRLHLGFPEATSMPINLSAEVMRIIQGPNSNANKIGVKFIGTTPHEQDILTKFILSEQRKKGRRA